MEYGRLTAGSRSELPPGRSSFEFSTPWLAQRNCEYEKQTSKRRQEGKARGPDHGDIVRAQNDSPGRYPAHQCGGAFGLCGLRRA
jgi:hypothetical protein